MVIQPEDRNARACAAAAASEIESINRSVMRSAVYEQARAGDSARPQAPEPAAPRDAGDRAAATRRRSASSSRCARSSDRLISFAMSPPRRKCRSTKCCLPGAHEVRGAATAAPRRRSHSRSRQKDSVEPRRPLGELPARDASYSMTPPVRSFRLTSDPSGHFCPLMSELSSSCRQCAIPDLAAPRSVCLLRLSAIGDTCHAVAVLRTLQRAWPQTQFTWIIGKTEARLMSLIEGVEFIIVDKRAGSAARRELRRSLRQREFDVLLHMQLAFRASLIARSIRATCEARL